MITLKNVTKKYYSKTAKVSTIALNNISLEINGPQLVFIVGKSGSGKSTMLNILGGLDRFDLGEMLVNNDSIKNYSDEDLDNYRNYNIGFIFQEYNLLDDLNVEDNIALANKLQGEIPSIDEINNLLVRLELSGYNKRLVEELSGGQKQRVAIARALIKNPLLILADEPTGSLDSDTSQQILKLLKDISKDKLVIVISHDREYAEEYADRIIELSDGEITSDIIKTPQAVVKPQVIDRPNNENNSLKLKETIKLGYSCIKHHKSRLITSIILMSLSLILFGMATTFLTYDERKLSLNGMINNDNYFISFERQKEFGFSRFSMQDIFLLSSQTQSDLRPVFNDELLKYEFSRRNDEYSSETIFFDRLMELSKNDSDKLHFNLISGSFASSPKEIVVTKLFYDFCIKYGFEENGQKVTINSYDDLLLRKINVFEIVGILDTNFDEEKYYPILFSEGSQSNSNYDFFTDEEYEQRVIRELNALFSTGPHNIIFLNLGYHELVMENDSLKNTIILSSPSVTIDFIREGEYLTYIEAISILGAYPRRSKNLDDLDVIPFPSNIYWKNDIPLTNLTHNQIIISFDKLMSFPDSQGTSEQRITEEVDFFISDFVNEHFSEVQNVFNDIEDYTRYIKYNTKDSENKYHPGKTYDYFYNLAITSLINKQGFSDINSSLEIEIEYDTRVPVEIVGVYLNSYDYELINYDTVFLSDEVYGNLVDTFDLDGYPILSAILSGDYKKDIGIINYLYDHEINYPCYDFYNDIIYSVKSAKMILLLLSSVFGGLAVLMTIFVSLIIYNYMIVSIQLKQKNIGIMRALGAKKKNIFLIFYSESIILAAINIVIALFGSFIASLSINYFLIKGYLKFSFSVLSYGIFNISAIVILALIIASLSTIPPILKFSKKQPIDIIKGII